jgi:putative transposase
MPAKRRSDERIFYMLRSVEEGPTIGDLFRELRVSDQTCFRWKKQYVGLGMAEIRRLKQPNGENATLKGALSRILTAQPMPLGH